MPEFIPGYIRSIEQARTDLFHIQKVYESFAELDLMKINQKLERENKVLEDKLKKEKEAHERTVKEKNMEIARLGLAVGEAMKYMPQAIPPNDMDLMP